jgi:hypothetical protein
MMAELRSTPDARAEFALGLMLGFADRTGLTSDLPADRYLWTDAFAVCNLLGLGRTDLALRLVDQVHQTLGRHRADDPHRGWISGLAPEEGALHPTSGGLRIGKPLPERRPGEPMDERLEWDREGQYFHYLTKWMHALDQVTRSTGDPVFNVWARELMHVAARAFIVPGTPGDRGRMAWKMSVDLLRPLVPSMGHHDPLDGYLTCVQLDATATSLAIPEGPDLAEEAGRFAAMIPSDLSTADPLGIGGLLADAWRVEQLRRMGAIDERELRDRLVLASLAGLLEYARAGELELSPAYRLAFRELGLAIGLAAIPLLQAGLVSGPELEALERFIPLRAEIESFWLDPEHRRTPTWLEHRNINEVMLATSLVPDSYLTLRS